MKISTTTYKGQQTYSIDKSILGIDMVTVNGKEVEASFFLEFPTVPTENGELQIDLIKAVVKETNKQ